MGQRYWQKKHENWCLEWLTADTRQQYYLYDKLHGAVYQMAQIIINRYFSFKYNEVDNVMKEAINNLFILLHKFDPAKSTAFTYCSMIIKHYFIDVQVKKRSHFLIEIEYCDRTENFNDTDKEFYEPNAEIDFKAILKRLDELKQKVVEDQASITDRLHSKAIRLKNDNMIAVLEKCKEYAIKFNNFDSYSVFEYCFHNLKLEKKRVSYYFGLLFNYTIINNQYSKMKTCSSYFQNDYAPCDLRKVRKNSKANKIINEEKYNYF